ncbi:MAG: NAD-dependent dehydratase [Candidatus Brocadiae bacterium]|nr:NAD-dependent dehydratase [Candidatus Brocadiia bacterium]
MRALVIGGTAFMGPHVVRGLAALGHEVAVFHRGKTPADLPSGAREILGDRRAIGESAPALRAFRPDVVVDMVLLSEDDVRGVHSVLGGVAGRLVAVSSVDAYRAYGVLIGVEGGEPEPAPLREEAPLRACRYPFRGKVPGMDLYDKVLVERAALGFAEMSATVLRLPMVHGPGDRQRRVREFLAPMDRGRKAILLDAAAAAWEGCRGYVENVAAAIVLAAVDARAAGRVYNVAEPVSRSQREWVAGIAAAAGWGGRTVELPAARLPERLRAGMNTAQSLAVDSSAIRRELGYREEVAWDEGLRRTVAWERAHPPAAPPPDSEADAEEDAILAGLAS